MSAGLLRSGMFNVLERPFDPAALSKKIEEVLGRDGTEVSCRSIMQNSILLENQ